MPRASASQSLSIPLEPIATRAVPLREASLFLDLDGTLANIMDRPEAVGPDARRNGLVREAAVILGGRLAVVSGRTLGDIDRILDCAAACAAGVHGLERRDRKGQVTRAPTHGGMDEAERVLNDLAASTPGLLVEPKALSVALHYRGAPTQQTAVFELTQRLARCLGLVLQEGSMVVELKTPGPDKGDAVRSFMTETPFLGSTPIVLGDDLTDEGAFVAAAEFGGLGVLVGPRRRTAAEAGLSDPDAVLDWLQASLTHGEFIVELLQP